MKISIKQLQAELAKGKEARLEAENKAWNLKNEQTEGLRKESFNIKRDYDLARDTQRQMLEIIRWHCNPETAKYPFVPEKGQLDEERLRRF